jgi:hypothetical protein
MAKAGEQMEKALKRLLRRHHLRRWLRRRDHW